MLHTLQPVADECMMLHKEVSLSGGLGDNLPLVRHHPHLLPMSFHPLCGKNIILSHDNCVASRLPDEYCNGYVFTARPILPGEQLVIQVSICCLICCVVCRSTSLIYHPYCSPTFIITLHASYIRYYQPAWRHYHHLFTMTT